MVLSSTPVKGSAHSLSVRPAKRPCLVLLKEGEEEEEEDEDSVSDFPEPHESTYEPGESLTEPSDVRLGAMATFNFEILSVCNTFFTD